MLGQLLSNCFINVAVVAWLSAQILKTLFTFLRTKKFDPERLVGAGGMPSSHSALVCSLTVSVARVVGFASAEFAICFALSGIVMYDAMGVRRAAGEQAKVLNRLAQSDEEESTSQKALKERLGHTPLEVLGGALLGILVAVLMPIR